MTVHEGRVCVFTVDNLQYYWMTAHSLSYGELKQTSVSSLLTWIFLSIVLCWCLLCPSFAATPPQALDHLCSIPKHQQASPSLAAFNTEKVTQDQVQNGLS